MARFLQAVFGDIRRIFLDQTGSAEVAKLAEKGIVFAGVFGKVRQLGDAVNRVLIIRRLFGAVDLIRAGGICYDNLIDRIGVGLDQCNDRGGSGVGFGGFLFDRLLGVEQQDDQCCD